MERTIIQHIESDKKELDGSNLSAQRRRHLESELESLEKYKIKHPDSEKDPTPLELFCDENPDALECKIFNL
jgi:hypothetical protein